MKFGCQVECICETLFKDERFGPFKASMVRYNDLKKFIKAIDFEKDCTSAAPSLSGECSICLESFHSRSEVLVTQCSHAFHPLCLVDSFIFADSPRSCPLCRASVHDLMPVGLERATFQFLFMIRSSINAVERCHVSFLRRAERQSQLLRKLQQTSLASLQEPLACSRNSGLKQEAENLCHMLRAAEIFVVVNRESLRRILRKFDRRSAAPISAACLDKMDGLSFCRDCASSGRLGSMLKRLEDDFGVLPEEGVAPLCGPDAAADAERMAREPTRPPLGPTALDAPAAPGARRRSVSPTPRAASRRRIC